MHALIVMLVLGAAGAEPAPDGGEKRGATLVEEARASLLDRPWHEGLAVDALGGVSAFPSTSNRPRISMDRFAGVRVGWHRAFRFLTVGPEAAWRSSNIVDTGASPFWPLAALQRLSGAYPQQVLRQENQASLAATLGARWRKLDYSIEAHALAGVSASLHTVMVTLERPLAYNRSFPTLGAVVGAGVTTGLDPVFLRMDVFGNCQAGPPPFGTQRAYAGYSLAAGVHW